MHEASATNAPDWRKETDLDPTIRFDGPLSADVEEPRAVFLTGATGFLGAYLLHEVLRGTGAEVHCLVRGDGAQRLRAHLAALGLPFDEKRIHLVRGDLASPLLGLSRAEFEALAARIDVIYHNGALTHFLRPYSALKGTNVLGTQEVLRLAGTGPTKRVHHTSTLAVFFGSKHLEAGRVSELDTPVLDEAAKSGYIQSKWVAERLVLSAMQRGLPAAIYRTSRITGHSETGATSNVTDLLNRLIKGCILLGAYPSSTADISMAPVDYMSRAILHLSRQRRSIGRAFHLFQPKPIPWNVLCQMIRDAGYRLVELSHDAFRAALKQAAQADHPEREAFAQLWLLMSGPNNLFSGRPRYETPYSTEGLADSSFVCPPIDEALVTTYLSFFQKSGYIPRPEDIPR